MSNDLVHARPSAVHVFLSMCAYYYLYTPLAPLRYNMIEMADNDKHSGLIHWGVDYNYRNKNIINLIKTQSTKTFLSEPVLIKAGPLIILCK